MNKMNPLDKRIAIVQIGTHRIFVEHLTKPIAYFGIWNKKRQVRYEIVIFPLCDLIRRIGIRKR